MPHRSGRYVAAVLCVALASCATQEIGNAAGGDPKQLAVISADSNLNFLPAYAVVVKEVDGAAVSAATSRIKVMPGPHKLTVECQFIEQASSNTQYLEIEARAGARYQLAVRIDPTTHPCRAIVVEQ